MYHASCKTSVCIQLLTCEHITCFLKTGTLQIPAGCANMESIFTAQTMHKGEPIFMENIIAILAATAVTGTVLNILFRKFNLRKRLAPKMQWWTPAALVVLFALTALLLVRLFGALDPYEHYAFWIRILEGAYLGFWLACVPVFSPNKRWDKP